MSDGPTRRDFLRNGGIGVLSFTLGGCSVFLSPAQAHKKGVPRSILTDEEAATLAAVGERCVPGSRGAGLVSFVDHQLAASAAECMLMVKYLGVDPPFAPFYQGGLGAIDAAARKRYRRPFATLGNEGAEALVDALAAGTIEGWSGPPQPLLLFVIRSDACDVTFGTQEGFEKLRVPYMAHITPPSPWG